MLVTVRGQRGITLDCFAEPTWAASGGQAIGSASLRIARDSLAWDSDIINEQGGMLVDIHTAAGLWRGIADRPTYTPAGMELEALHINAWATIRHVATGRRMFGVTAGAVAKRAVRDALVGLGSVPVTMGAILEAPPLINYAFDGQSLISVLTDLQNQTGQTWLIDDLLRFAWVQQVGKYQELTVIDDGQFLGHLSGDRLADQYLETVEIEQSGRTFTAFDRGAPALWPAQRITRI